MGNPMPQCLAMILCDQIITDQATGKHVLIGTFNQIKARNLPAVHPAMGVFIALTGGRGEYEGHLRLIHAETEQVLFEARDKVTFDDPLQVLEIRIMLPPLRFEHAGLYHLELFVDETLVIGRKFSVRGDGQDEE